MNSWRRLVAALCSAFAFVTCSVSATEQPSGDIWPHEDNTWHMLYTVHGYSTTGEFKPVTEFFPDASPDHPHDVAKTFRDPVNKIVLETPPYECVNDGPPETNACVFTSGGVTQQDDHTVSYTLRNWGGRVHMNIRLLAYAPSDQPNWSITAPWADGSPFVVTVESAWTSATVFGTFHHEHVFFTPSDPLSPQDAQRFELLDKKVIPNFGVIYRFKVK